MKQITRILCPIDFSDFSTRALDHAAAIARWYGAKVTAAHVFHVPAMLAAALAHAEGPVLMPEGREELLAKLRALVDPIRQSGVSIEAAVREGDVVTEVKKLADAMPADLIVMGTHGRRGYERWLLGSVTERMLRSTTCPVLTVPRATSGAAASPAAWTTILCPVDFSPSSMSALKYATSLALQAGAHLILVHVVEWFLDDAVAGNAYPELVRYYKALKDEAMDRLRGLVPAEASDWCRAEEVIAGGKPYEGILRAAQRVGAGVIVMGAQGHTGVDLALFGSTTQNVIRSATCPVLSVRALATA
jgi:nucleotide-binding universal stress UspA family protein